MPDTARIEPITRPDGHRYVFRGCFRFEHLKLGHVELAVAVLVSGFKLSIELAVRLPLGARQVAIAVAVEVLEFLRQVSRHAADRRLGASGD